MDPSMEIDVRQHDLTRVNKVTINIELGQGTHQTFEQFWVCLCRRGNR